MLSAPFIFPLLFLVLAIIPLVFSAYSAGATNALAGNSKRSRL